MPIGNGKEDNFLQIRFRYEAQANGWWWGIGKVGIV